MGATFSQGNNVFVHLSGTTYHGGDVVDGFICLNCVTPFACNQILLRVEAYEKTRWTERHTRAGQSNDDVFHHRAGTHDFFRVAIPLQSYRQMCTPGQYQFPFQFVLPMNLPGSFEWNSAHHRDSRGHECTNTKAKIRYVVKAECVVPGMLKANIRSKHHIAVFQRLLKAPTSVLANHTQEVTTCCCFGKGTAHMTAQIDRDSYAPGETASITLQVDNQSEIAFSEVRVSCSRIVELRASGCVQKHESMLAETAFPGIHAFTTQMGEQARHLQITLPPTMLPTALGVIVQCTYMLVVRCKAPTFTTDVVLKVPLTIYVPPPHNFMVQPPPYWQPTVMGQPVHLALPAAPPVAPPQQTMMFPSQIASGTAQQYAGGTPQGKGQPVPDAESSWLEGAAMPRHYAAVPRQEVLQGEPKI